MWGLRPECTGVASRAYRRFRLSAYNHLATALPIRPIRSRHRVQPRRVSFPSMNPTAVTLGVFALVYLGLLLGRLPRAYGVV